MDCIFFAGISGAHFHRVRLGDGVLHERHRHLTGQVHFNAGFGFDQREAFRDLRVDMSQRIGKQRVFTYGLGRCYG